jgi:hypothetical protein
VNAGRVLTVPACIHGAKSYFLAIAFTRASSSFFKDAGAGDVIFLGFASSLVGSMRTRVGAAVMENFFSSSPSFLNSTAA